MIIYHRIFYSKIVPITGLGGRTREVTILHKDDVCIHNLCKLLHIVGVFKGIVTAVTLGNNNYRAVVSTMTKHNTLLESTLRLIAGNQLLTEFHKIVAAGSIVFLNLLKRCHLGNLFQHRLHLGVLRIHRNSCNKEQNKEHKFFTHNYYFFSL